MLTAEQKAEWTAALRSGEYRQGRRRLVTADGGYCCLGVLCEAVLKASMGTSARPGFIIDGEFHTTLLPERLVPLNEQKILSSMNDSDPGKDFIQIAGWIDKNVSTSG